MNKTPTVDKIKKPKYKKCQVCGKKDKTVKRRACGYSEEISNTIVMETICDACEYEHLMDI